MQLAALPRLEHLSLSQLKNPALPAALAHMPHLQRLELSSCWRIVDLGGVAAFPQLQELVLHRFEGASLPVSPTLRRVHVMYTTTLRDVWALSACPLLEVLVFRVCHGLRDLSALADCTNLQTLELDRCTGVRDLAPLSACARLHTLRLELCPGVTDLSALTACASLQQLSVVECSGLTHFSAPCRVARALVRLRAVAGENRDEDHDAPEDTLEEAAASPQPSAFLGRELRRPRVLYPSVLIGRSSTGRFSVSIDRFWDGV